MKKLKQTQSKSKPSAKQILWERSFWKNTGGRQQQWDGTGEGEN